MKKTNNGQLYYCDLCDNEEVRMDDLVLIRNKNGTSVSTVTCNPEKGQRKLDLDTLLICKICMAKSKPKGWVRKKLTLKVRV